MERAKFSSQLPSTRFLHCSPDEFLTFSTIMDAMACTNDATMKDQLKSDEFVYAEMTFKQIRSSWLDFLRDLYEMTSRCGYDLSSPAKLCFGLNECPELGEFIHRKMLSWFSWLVIEKVFFGVKCVFRKETSLKSVAVLTDEGIL